MGYANLTNLPNKGVDLSAVTQAANQSSLTSGARSGGTTLPPNGNPATSLYNAGNVSQMGKTFADYGQKVGQVSIPGVWDDNKRNSGGGGGQPQIAPGSYDPKTLSQDQRQQLWEFFGHKGMAPAGYGGENPKAPIVDNPSTLTSFLPSFTPPPSPVSSATMVPPSTSGATAAPQSLSSTGGGVSGQAFQALTQAGQALSGLGNLTSIPSSILKGLEKQLTTPGFGLFSSPTSQTQTNKPLVEVNNPQADTGGARDILKPFAEGLPKFIGKGGELIASGGIGAAPEMGVKAGIEALPSIAKTIGGFAKPITGAIGGLLGVGASAPANPGEGAYKQGTGFGQATEEGGFKTAPRGTTSATSQNVLGNIRQPDNIARAVVSALREPKNVENVITGIASEEAKPVINSMIQTAAKQGDMGTVQELIGILNGVQKQINFNNMIQQAITAISGGFGVPNAPGVTAARTPMVQQGVGRALETPFQAPAAPVFNQQSSPAQSLSPRLPTAEVQQQRPQLNPYMGA